MAPLLPLETWREILGFSSWHFWGLADDDVAPVTSACNDVIYKHAWQGTGAAGRDAIAQAVEWAEDKLHDYLKFWPAPKYGNEETSWPSYYRATMFPYGRSAIDGRWPTVNLDEGYIQALGVESLTLVGNANLTYSDKDGDGLNDTFTLSIATVETDPTKLAVYFTATDRWDDSPVGVDWRVQPVRVTISAGTATITGKRWLVVKPVKYETQEVQTPLEASDANNFVTQLAVYRRTTDPTGTTADNAQVRFTWETSPYPYWFGSYCCASVTDDSSDPAATGSVAGRGGHT